MVSESKCELRDHVSTVETRIAPYRNSTWRHLPPRNPSSHSRRKSVKSSKKLRRLRREREMTVEPQR